MRCGIVGMGTRSVWADQGITPTIAHVPTGIVHRLPRTKGRLEIVPTGHPLPSHYVTRELLPRLLPLGVNSPERRAATMFRGHGPNPLMESRPTVRIPGPAGARRRPRRERPAPAVGGLWRQTPGRHRTQTGFARPARERASARHRLRGP